MVKIAVMLFTHRRPEYAQRTLRRLLDHIEGVDLHIHIADDDSPREDEQALIDIVEKEDGRFRVTGTHAGGAGYGGSYNRATNMVHQLEGIDAVLPLEDDWELQRPFDPTPYVEALKNGAGRSIRLGYIGVTQSLDMRTKQHGGRLYLELNPRSKEPHVFAGHPRLETIEYERDVGVWPEHVGPGSTEFEVAQRLAARKGVLWPGDLPLTGGLFAHIGTIQAREDQRPAEVAG